MIRTLGFEITPRAHRADELVPKIHRLSRAFVAAYNSGDAVTVSKVSREAWDLLGNLFEILRNEADQGRLDRRYMKIDTGHLINGLDPAEASMMVKNRRIDRKHASIENLSLRECLNKVAHFNTVSATFRVDNRGAHYLVLSGIFNNKIWVAEILVSRLCRNSMSAVKALRA